MSFTRFHHDGGFDFLSPPKWKEGQGENGRLILFPTARGGMARSGMASGMPVILIYCLNRWFSAWFDVFIILRNRFPTSTNRFRVIFTLFPLVLAIFIQGMTSIRNRLTSVRNRLTSIRNRLTSIWKAKTSLGNPMMAAGSWADPLKWPERSQAAWAFATHAEESQNPENSQRCSRPNNQMRNPSLIESWNIPPVLFPLLAAWLRRFPLPGLIIRRSIVSTPEFGPR